MDPPCQQFQLGARVPPLAGGQNMGSFIEKAWTLSQGQTLKALGCSSDFLAPLRAPFPLVPWER